MQRLFLLWKVADFWLTLNILCAGY